MEVLMKKKILPLLLALVTLIFASSCGNNNTQSTSSATPEEVAQAACDELKSNFKNELSETRDYVLENATLSDFINNKGLETDKEIIVENTVKPIIDEIVEVNSDIYDIKVTDVQVDGDTAVANLEVSYIQGRIYDSFIKEKVAQGNYTYGDFRKLAEENIKTSNSDSFNLSKENGEWVANTDEFHFSGAPDGSTICIAFKMSFLNLYSSSN
jgi:hypothetical protein